ncbi:ribosome maturation factor RimM [Schleiferiaceae bacterium]|nr:ribosome maturation factor RimM [Schleiferiaceae bacterium]
MQKEQCFLLGKITKLHGYKGSMVLFIDSSTPQYFKHLESVFLEINQELIPFFFSQRGKLNGKKLIVTLEDINSEQATSLVGSSAYLPKEMLPSVAEGFYDKAIIGFKAISKGEVIGSIVDVIENTAQSLFLIKGERENLVPAVEAFIKEIDHQNKKVYLELPEGLLDL